MWTAPSLRAEVSIEGELQFHSVYRDNVYDFLDKRVIDPANPGLGEAGRDDAHFWDSQLNLDFTASLAGNISMVAGLQSNFLWGLSDDVAGDNPTNNSSPDLRTAYIELREFIRPSFTLRVGLQSLSYDLRGNGNEFFLNTDERENRRWLTSDTVFLNTPAATNGIASAGFGFSPSNATNVTPHIGDGNSSVAGAVKVVWDADPFFVDFFLAKLGETTGTGFRDDHDIAGIVVDYLLGEDSIVRGHLLYVHNEKFTRKNPGFNQSVGGNNVGFEGNNSFFQFGIGISYVLDWGNPFELYAEFGYQNGDFGDFRDVAGAVTKIEQDAFAFMAGLRYTFENVAYRPWIDFSYTFISGDKDSTDGDSEAWIPYGDIDDTMIFEENHYGLGVNSGYRALKAKAGFKPSEEIELKFIFGIFWSSEDSFLRLDPNTNTNLTLTTEDGLGQEIDLIGTWNYTEDVTFNLGVGFFATDQFWDDVVDLGDDTIISGNALMFDIGLNAKF